MTHIKPDVPIGIVNPTFLYEPDDVEDATLQKSKELGSKEENSKQHEGAEKLPARDQWDHPVEFLMSCIAMSVGLGNVWRFPFTAYENGGGAFLIPYLVVLLLIGKPLYFFEMILGQFSSNSFAQVWSLAPIATGIGYMGAVATWFVVTYYAALMAVAIYYLFASFQSTLPWTYCDPAWLAEGCFNSSISNQNVSDDNVTGGISSASLYFSKMVLNQTFNIDDGIGTPEWQLTLCLLFAWLIVGAVLIKGVASSGKAAYFTALFPYVVLVILLVRGVTLPGATEGILFFIRPQWDKLYSPQVWYAAVTQCFFSLNIAFGSVITNSSFNRFRHNIYKDAAIVSFLDTFTSLLAGVTIFSILGYLAHETGRPIESVVQGGTGLAFVSYPEVLAKFDVVPQLFAVLFFLMLLTLSVGSAVADTNVIITIICDAFPFWKRWIVTTCVCLAAFAIGVVYITPGGMYIMDVVDFFGGGFVIYVTAFLEAVTVCWIYGLRKFVRDVEFMLDIKLSMYWKITWAVFIPLALLAIFIYSLVDFPKFESNGYEFPIGLVATGWVIAAVGLVQVPLWAGYQIMARRGGESFVTGLKRSLQPSDSWGPKNPAERSAWLLSNANIDDQPQID